MPAVLKRHILSASVAVSSLLVMSQYFSEAFSIGNLTGKNTGLNRFIARRASRGHACKPVRRRGLTEAVYTKVSLTIIEHGFSFVHSCE